MVSKTLASNWSQETMGAGGFLSAVLLGLYLLIFAWAPLPLGSDTEWARSLLEVLILGLFCLVLLPGVVRPRRWLACLKPYALPCTLFVVWLLYQALALVPLPVAMLEWISPAKATWFLGLPSEGGEATARLGASFYGAQIVLLKNLCYFAAFLSALLLFDSRRKIVAGVVVMVLVGLFESVYGLAVRHMHEDFPFWRPVWDGHHWVNGTFVNKNHYAALLSFSIAILISVIAVSVESATGREGRNGLRQLFLSFTAFLASKSTLLLAPLALLLYAFLSSQSRGALIGLFCAFCLVGIVRARSFVSSVAALSGALLFAIATLMVAELLGALAVFSRMAHIFDGSDQRWDMWRQSLPMLKDHWFLGTGNGSYKDVFPFYKLPPLENAFTDYAHNDHLQLLIEQGVVGFVLFGGLFLITVRRVLVAYNRSARDGNDSGLLLGILVGLIAFALHGFVDFTMHIPANALWFYTLMAMGLRLSQLQRVRSAGRASLQSASGRMP